MSSKYLAFVEEMMSLFQKFPSKRATNKSHLSTAIMRMGKQGYDVKKFLTAPLLAIGLVVGNCECDTNSCPPKSSRIPPCTTQWSNEESSHSASKIPCPPPKLPVHHHPCPAPQIPKPPMACALGVDVSKHESKQEPEELTHPFLLRQASTVIVDTVTRLLTETVSAFDDYHQQYRHLMELLIGLLDESRVAKEGSQDLINCKMIVLRSQMEDVKRNLQEIELFLCSVEALVNQAAQTAYLARAEYPSIALSERLHSALLQVNRIRSETKEMESDLVQLQAVVIVESGNSLK